MDYTMATAQNQHSLGLQGLGNNGGPPPPHDNKKLDPLTGHYGERIRATDCLKVMKDAGTGPKHTCCFHCGKPASTGHRKAWRKCRHSCPCCGGDEDQHYGMPCPKLMAQANGEWCWSHVHDDLTDERAAVRNPEQVAKNLDRRIAARNGRARAPTRPVHLEPGQPSRGFHDRTLGVDAGLEHSSFGADKYSTYSRYGADNKYPPVGVDSRERSPMRNSDIRQTNYRDRAPPRAQDSSSHGSLDRLPPSTRSVVSWYAGAPPQQPEQAMQARLDQQHQDMTAAFEARTQQMQQNMDQAIQTMQEAMEQAMQSMQHAMQQAMQNMQQAVRHPRQDFEHQPVSTTPQSSALTTAAHLEQQAPATSTSGLIGRVTENAGSLDHNQRFYRGEAERITPNDAAGYKDSTHIPSRMYAPEQPRQQPDTDMAYRGSRSVSGNTGNLPIPGSGTMMPPFQFGERQI